MLPDAVLPAVEKTTVQRDCLQPLHPDTGAQCISFAVTSTPSLRGPVASSHQSARRKPRCRVVCGTTMFHEIDEHMTKEMTASAPPTMRSWWLLHLIKYSVCRVVCGTTMFQEIDEHMMRTLSSCTQHVYILEGRVGGILSRCRRWKCSWCTLHVYVWEERAGGIFSRCRRWMSALLVHTARLHLGRRVGGIYRDVVAGRELSSCTQHVSSDVDGKSHFYELKSAESSDNNKT